MAKNEDFHPDWVSAPGQTIADILEEQKLSLVEFAKRIGYSPDHANDVLQGRAAITIEIARLLEGALGASAEFWMCRESQYRKDAAGWQDRKQGKVREEWLSELPVKEMVKFGWIKSGQSAAEDAAACLRFFNVPDEGTWRKKYRDVFQMTAFRTSPSFDSKPGAVATWLRQGEIQGSSIDCEPWDSRRFHDVLPGIRSLTRKKDPDYFIPELQKRCAGCGVAVVIVRAPAGCRASGATRFLSQNKALLLLSFRHLSDDHFWFTFFHEAGHLLLHSDTALFLEGANMSSTKEEEEADAFSFRSLISPEFHAMLSNLPVDRNQVVKFARMVGVSPGIVVGQLQHIGRFQRSQLNSLKRRFHWDND